MTYSLVAAKLFIARPKADAELFSFVVLADLYLLQVRVLYTLSVMSWLLSRMSFFDCSWTILIFVHFATIFGLACPQYGYVCTSLTSLHPVLRASLMLFTDHGACSQVFRYFSFTGTLSWRWVSAAFSLTFQRRCWLAMVLSTDLAEIKGPLHERHWYNA